MAESPSPAVHEQLVRVIGHRWSAHVHEIKDLLARRRVPYRWIDIENDRRGMKELELVAAGAQKFPIVAFPDGTVLVQPSARELAERIGLDTEADARFYDLIVVGGGPAGLAAAVYGASEGLRTLIIEREVPGGQAGQSACIENYLGFDRGVSGSELARRAVAQAERFGVEILATREAKAVRAWGRYREVTLDDGTELFSHAVLIAAGVSFRWLDAPGCPALVGAGVYYGAAIAEAGAFTGQDVYLLGGGNSAGQAAVLLAEYAAHVIMLMLEDTLEETMSQYLAERIRGIENISVRPHTTVVGAEGRGRLEHLTLRDTKTDVRERVCANGLFVFIGARPSTEWLRGTLALDREGFVLAGDDLPRDDHLPSDWPLERDPYPMETSTPGIFVAGDVRHGSVKRLASAVGEGAMAVHFIHSYLADR